MSSIVEEDVFLVKTNLIIHPQFFVAGKDLVDAATKAGIIVQYYGQEKIVLSVSAMETKLLSLEDTTKEEK